MNSFLLLKVDCPRFGGPRFGAFPEVDCPQFDEVNFVLDGEAAELFDGSLTAEDLYKKISAYKPETRLIPGKTLIFLDEIQECANARTALKSFALDGRYDVIASGSLLGIKYKNKKAREKRVPKSIPVGYERIVKIRLIPVF